VTIYFKVARRSNKHNNRNLQDHPTDLRETIQFQQQSDRTHYSGPQTPLAKISPKEMDKMAAKAILACPKSSGQEPLDVGPNSISDRAQLRSRVDQITPISSLRNGFWRYERVESKNLGVFEFVRAMSPNAI